MRLLTVVLLLWHGRGQECETEDQCFLSMSMKKSKKFAACCSNGCSTYCSPQSGSCYDTQAKSYYQKCFSYCAHSGDDAYWPEHRGCCSEQATVTCDIGTSEPQMRCDYCPSCAKAGEDIYDPKWKSANPSTTYPTWCCDGSEANNCDGKMLCGACPVTETPVDYIICSYGSGPQHWQSVSARKAAAYTCDHKSYILCRLGYERKECDRFDSGEYGCTYGCK